ncbi:hypothetical protein [Burkholderia gladioli]|uniref:hypothetical protein n=1 Tax=Burkholderia gladioli TaxID=28095 RepID=UPI0005C28EF9|nr:hypothetical protein [Burkholderia gladioli]
MEFERIEHSDKLIPKRAEGRLYDLFSATSSAAAKGNAARWYAEMIIDLLLGERLKAERGVAAFRRLSLGEKLEGIRADVDPAIIDSLRAIKDFGDKASHYDPDQVLSPAEARQSVDRAIDLIVQILIDELKVRRLDSHAVRARIFSTLFPDVRVRVLSSLIDFAKPLDEYQLALIHKFCIACVKNEQFNKARRKLDEWLDKNRITTATHAEEMAAIKEIAHRMREGVLPIARRMEDVARNFHEVLKDLSDSDRAENSRLILIIETWIDKILPSDMGDLIGDQVFPIHPEAVAPDGE